jgi:hypothetical protein
VLLALIEPAVAHLEFPSGRAYPGDGPVPVASLSENLQQFAELWLNGTKAMYLLTVGKWPKNPGDTWEAKFAEESVWEDLEDARDWVLERVGVEWIGVGVGTVVLLLALWIVGVRKVQLKEVGVENEDDAVPEPLDAARSKADD